MEEALTAARSRREDDVMRGAAASKAEHGMLLQTDDQPTGTPLSSGIGKSIQKPLQYVDNLCQSFSSLVLQVQEVCQGTLEKYFSDDEEQKPTLRTIPAPDVPERRAPHQRRLTSSLERRHRPASNPAQHRLINFRARASKASSSSEEPDQKSGRKKNDKDGAGA